MYQLIVFYLFVAKETKNKLLNSINVKAFQGDRKSNKKKKNWGIRGEEIKFCHFEEKYIFFKAGKSVINCFQNEKGNLSKWKQKKKLSKTETFWNYIKYVDTTRCFQLMDIFLYYNSFNIFFYRTRMYKCDSGEYVWLV